MIHNKYQANPFMKKDRVPVGHCLQDNVLGQLLIAFIFVMVCLGVLVVIHGLVVIKA